MPFLNTSGDKVGDFHVGAETEISKGPRVLPKESNQLVMFVLGQLRVHVTANDVQTVTQLLMGHVEVHDEGPGLQSLVDVTLVGHEDDLALELEGLREAHGLLDIVGDPAHGALRERVQNGLEDIHGIVLVQDRVTVVEQNHSVLILEEGPVEFGRSGHTLHVKEMFLGLADLSGMVGLAGREAAISYTPSALDEK
jgi:hypothetical protein